MGMLLDDPDGIAGMDMRTYYSNQLENDKILLNQLTRAISYFLSDEGAGAVAEYTIDTGQDRQTVKRSELQSLVAQRQKLLFEIDSLNRALHGNQWSRVIPGF